MSTRIHKTHVEHGIEWGISLADDPELQNRRLQLKMALEDLSQMRGFGTELVTVIIPPDRKISDARQLLQNEHGQAANIKSKSTRKNVQGAIESAISSLNNYNNLPDSYSQGNHIWN